MKIQRKKLNSGTESFNWFAFDPIILSSWWITVGTGYMAMRCQRYKQKLIILFHQRRKTKLFRFSLSFDLTERNKVEEKKKSDEKKKKKQQNNHRKRRGLSLKTPNDCLSCPVLFHSF